MKTISIYALPVVLAGDTLTLTLTTAYGFSAHGTLGTAGVRILATLLPVVATWFLAAASVGALNVHWSNSGRELWRPVLAMVLATPLAVSLRGFWLNSTVLPVFVFILTGINSLAILTWRALYLLAISKMIRAHG